MTNLVLRIEWVNGRRSERVHGLRHPNTGVMGSSPTRYIDVYVFTVYIVLCVGSDLAPGFPRPSSPAECV
jgi:hypothetical protein